MYILNIRRALNPNQVTGSYRATIPFPAINPGHFFGVGYQRVEVKEVKHTLLPNDWVIDLLVSEPMAGLLQAEGGGSTNPVPWPKKSVQSVASQTRVRRKAKTAKKAKKK